MTDAPPRGLSLHTKILLGLLLGAASGVAVNQAGLAPRLDWLIQYVAEPVGQVFMRLLLMTVVPLVFASLAVGVAKLGDLGRIGRIGAKTLAYFVLTMTSAVLIGLALVNAVAPGERLPDEQRQELRSSYEAKRDAREQPARFGLDTFLNIVPRNPVKAAADMDMLGVIFFALLVGIGITTLSADRSALLVNGLEAFGDVMVYIIHLAMKFAPYGVFALIFRTTAQFGFEFLVSLGLYVAVVLTGLALQMFGVLSILLATLGRVRPVEFFWRVRNVMITAFSTSSSNATLPTSLKTTEEELGVPPQVAGFVLPLGATMNMNGTALFEGMTAVFLAQVFGVDLGLGGQAVIVILSVLTAIGAAGVPGGSIPLLALVVSSVPDAAGRTVPPAAIGIILGVDRLLDMCRTTLNVIGDVTAAVVVARSEGFEVMRPVPPGGTAEAAQETKQNPNIPV